MDFVDMYAVKRELERMSCPDCHERPNVTVSGDSFNINCCCERFKERLREAASKEITAQTKKNIDDQLRNIFK